MSAGAYNLVVECPREEFARRFYVEEFGVGATVSFLRSPPRSPADVPPHDYGRPIGTLAAWADVAGGTRFVIRPTADGGMIEQVIRRMRGSRIMVYTVADLVRARQPHVVLEIAGVKVPLGDAEVTLNRDEPRWEVSDGRPDTVRRQDEVVVKLDVGPETKDGRPETLEAARRALHEIDLRRAHVEDGFFGAMARLATGGRDRTDPRAFNVEAVMRSREDSVRRNVVSAIAKGTGELLETAVEEGERAATADWVSMVTIKRQTIVDLLPATHGVPDDTLTFMAEAFATADARADSMRYAMEHFNRDIERTVLGCLPQASLAEGMFQRRPSIEHYERALQVNYVSDSPPAIHMPQAFGRVRGQVIWATDMAAGGLEGSVVGIDAVALGSGSGWTTEDRLRMLQGREGRDEFLREYQADAFEPAEQTDQRRRKGAVEKKARALLESVLTDKQRNQLRHDGYFEVRGSHTRTLYRVARGRGGVANVYVLDGGEVIRTAYCAAPDQEGLPEDDILCAQALSIAGDERAFLSVAIATPMDVPWEAAKRRFFSRY